MRAKSILVSRDAVETAAPLTDRGVSFNSLLPIALLMGIAPNDEDYPSRGGQSIRRSMRLPENQWKKVEKVRQDLEKTRSQVVSAYIRAMAREIAAPSLVFD